MISDELSDAAHNIESYLKDPSTYPGYQKDKFLVAIRQLLEHMAAIREYLDHPNPATLQCTDCSAPRDEISSRLCAGCRLGAIL